MSFLIDGIWKNGFHFSMIFEGKKNNKNNYWLVAQKYTFLSLSVLVSREITKLNRCSFIFQIRETFYFTEQQSYNIFSEKVFFYFFLLFNYQTSNEEGCIICLCIQGVSSSRDPKLIFKLLALEVWLKKKNNNK